MANAAPVCAVLLLGCLAFWPVQVSTADATAVFGGCGEGERSVCIPCNTDYKKKGVKDKATVCASCGDGTDCGKRCGDGKYSDGDRCRPCKQGTYKKLKDYEPCTPCKDGYSTQDKKSTTETDCNVCAAGAYASGTACIPCAVGSFKEGIGNDTSCTTCEAGYNTNKTGSTSSNDCKRSCPVGKQSDETGKNCVDCLANTFKKAEGILPCEQCQKFYTSPAGSIGCRLECPAGYESDGTSCSPCKFGFVKYWSGNDYPCIACDAGTTTKGIGATECVEDNCITRVRDQMIEYNKTLQTFNTGDLDVIQVMTNFCESEFSADSDALIDALKECEVLKEAEFDDVFTIGDHNFTYKQFIEWLTEEGVYTPFCDYIGCVPEAIDDMKRCADELKDKSFCSNGTRAAASCIKLGVKQCTSVKYHKVVSEVDLGKLERIKVLEVADSAHNFCTGCNASYPEFEGNATILEKALSDNETSFEFICKYSNRDPMKALVAMANKCQGLLYTPVMDAFDKTEHYYDLIAHVYGSVDEFCASPLYDRCVDGSGYIEGACDNLANTVCFESMCVCDDEHGFIDKKGKCGKDEEEAPNVGQACEKDGEKCPDIDNTVCKERTCQCTDGFHTIDGKTCQEDAKPVQ